MMKDRDSFDHVELDSSVDVNELARMNRLFEESGFSCFGVNPYYGRTEDIDLTKEWYCPNCEGMHKLKLNEVLICTNPIDDFYCEYQFANIEQRIKREVWWSKGFKYPLTYKEVLEKVIAAKELSIEQSKKTIERQNNYIIDMTKELIELKARRLA